jgi:hypothetical protein
VLASTGERQADHTIEDVDRGRTQVKRLIRYAQPAHTVQYVVEASTDFAVFYAQRAITPVLSPSTVLVISQDGEGITLRHEDLRAATCKAEEKQPHTLSTRLSSGLVFFDSSDKEQAKEAEQWVLEKASAILEGRSGNVAAGIRIKAKSYALSAKQRKTIGKVAKYLANHTEMLRYDLYLQQRYPIATGAIEGACRHLIADQFEITVARWSLETAEGILSLRAIRSSGDGELYQAFHKKQEWRRNHLQRFHESEMKAMVWDK